MNMAAHIPVTGWSTPAHRLTAPVSYDLFPLACGVGPFSKLLSLGFSFLNWATLFRAGVHLLLSMVDSSALSVQP